MPQSSAAHPTDPALAELAVVERSGMIESRHFGSIVAIGPDGEPLLELGAPDARILPRSTVKPLQALACLSVGAELRGPELAIAAGSHTGQDQHVSVVSAMLERAGLDESALGCPADRPEDEPTFERLLRTGAARTPIRMNCSGKHAAMLLACAASGWTTHDYLDHGHPIQQAVRGAMADATGVDVSHDAVDGCGAPLFDTTVRGLAHAFRTLVLADPTTPEGRVAAAMRTHPFYVGGTGHQNSRLMETVPGTLAKGGAEGVIGVAAADGTAVAMKIVDGNPRATTLLALDVLGALGIDVSGAAELARVPVLGGGRPVGAIGIGADLDAALTGPAAAR
ncbi:asparaginase [Agromyces sp. SYSU K20354]|uniref:asparaginase n=1 Tax=Agromyces cavernae TaxID=2898659 RepID=UPI001E33B26B|nr:asparaginase [Agromyces cavernae]MCD2443843.1 asparaginase [Agromyces cavernae]